MPDGTPENQTPETPVSRAALRYDRQESPDFHFETRADGSILTVARGSVCGVLKYKVGNGERLELVDEETLNDPDYLAGSRFRPTTLEHPPVMVTPENIGEYRKGMTTDLSEFRVDAHYLGTVLDDADLLAAVKDGKHEVSLGYECDLLETPGNHPKYGRYDAIQRNRRTNHLAVCDNARGGPTVKLLRTDSLVGEYVRMDAADPAPIPPQTEPPKMLSPMMKDTMKALGYDDAAISSCADDDAAHMMIRSMKKDMGKADEVAPELAAKQAEIVKLSADLAKAQGDLAVMVEQHELLADDAVPAAMEKLADDGPMMEDTKAAKMDSARRDAIVANRGKAFKSFHVAAMERARLFTAAVESGVPRMDAENMGAESLAYETAKKRFPASVVESYKSKPGVLRALLSTPSIRVDSADPGNDVQNQIERGYRGTGTQEPTFQLPKSCIAKVSK